MNILLIGPYFKNTGHGAECGIYDALKELGHFVTIFDNRINKIRLSGRDIQMVHIDNIINTLSIYPFDIVLCPGPGLTEPLKSNLKRFSGKKIFWNSEPIRLNGYKNKAIENKHIFDYYFTFDESEVCLYNTIDIDAKFLPQAYNPRWYFAQEEQPTKDICFVGSTGPKWEHRRILLERVSKSFSLTSRITFDARAVNSLYNDHKLVLNLGLYSPEYCGATSNLKSFGLQQRIFESIGAGRVCVTNAIPEDTNIIFAQATNVLYYDKESVEAVIHYGLNDKTRYRMEAEIAKIRHQHTYKYRMQQMLAMVNGEVNNIYEFMNRNV